MSNDIRWEKFLKTYKRNYTGNEINRRRAIFNKNIDIIDSHNEKYAKGEESFEMGINHFIDMTQHEASKTFMRNGKRNYHSNGYSEKSGNVLNGEKHDLPTQVDWRKKNAVTGIKQQWFCGSCYAFGALGSLEGQYALKHKKLVSFSAQNIVDCSGPDGNSGCVGGTISATMNYIQRVGGIDTEKQYPYLGFKTKCRFHNNTLKVSGYKWIHCKSEDDLKRAVAEIGPITVGLMNADNSRFQFYIGGLLHFKNGTKSKVYHFAVIVGYGVEHKNEYWLIKNSWGLLWGHFGYFKLARNMGNQCGIINGPGYPILS